jgi:predicted enzyme related to lactoylglutathione lyase
MLNTKKFGDIAFRDKDFKTAIDYYSKVFSLQFSVYFLTSLSLYHNFYCPYIAAA